MQAISESGPAARRSACPIACSLDLLGDRWTLLVVRDLFAGKHRYNHFLASPEHIPTNILADRLRRLEHAELIEAAPYGTHSRRRDYRLTPAGEALRPILRAFSAWGHDYLPDTRALISLDDASDTP